MEMRDWIVGMAVVFVPALMTFIGVVYGTRAAKNKEDASAASILTGSALSMVQNMEAKMDKLELRIDELEKENITWMKEYRYLWDGNSENVRYIEHNLGKIAPFKPSIDRFRGTIDYRHTREQTGDTSEESEE